MTPHEQHLRDRERMLAYIRKEKVRRCEKRIALLVVIGFALLVFALGVILGWQLTVHAVRTTAEAHAEQTVQSSQQAPDVTAPSTEIMQAQVPAPETRTPTVSECDVLNPELQEFMQAACKNYGVPFALALAVAGQESQFDPDAVSDTDDYGLMQINSINFSWLREQGIEPLTYKGNIEAGVLMLSKALEQYSDYKCALMAYNCGDEGAKRLWEQGIYSTAYTDKVMAAYETYKK